MIKFSVVVPIYNVEKYLPTCIESILSQTYKDFELLLIDDGSMDGSPAICDQYACKDNRVKVHHIENQGVASARNHGIRNAQGSYLYFVDGDDCIRKDALKSFDEILLEMQEPDLILGRMHCFVDESETEWDDDWIIPKQLVEGKSGKEAYAAIIAHARHARMGVRGVYRREFLWENELFFKKHIFSEDLEWSMRVFVKAKTISSNVEPCYMYRCQRKGSLLNSFNIEKAKDNLSIYQEWCELALSETSTFSDALLDDASSRMLEFFLRYDDQFANEQKKVFESLIRKYSYILRKSKSVKRKGVGYCLMLLGPGFTYWLVKKLEKKSSSLQI